MLKKCPKCEREYNERDFYGKEVCYRCSYQRKTEADIHTLQRKRCRACEKPVEASRTYYCSAECAKKHDDDRKKNAWYKKLKDKKEGWKYHPLDFRQLGS